MTRHFLQRELPTEWREDIDVPTSFRTGTSLMDVWAALWSQKLLFLIVLGLMTTVGVFLALKQQKYYYANALVALGSGQQERYVDNDAPENNVLSINTEVETLGATVMMDRIIELIGPEQAAAAIGFENPEYFRDIDAPIQAGLRSLSPGALGVEQTEPDKAGSGSLTGDPADSPPVILASDREPIPAAPDFTFSISDILPIESRDAWSQNMIPHSRRELLIRSLQNAVTVRRRTQSDVIEVGFTTPEPVGAVELSAAIITAYLQSKASQRQDAAQRASEWLQARVEELGGEVNSKEQAIADFRINNELLAIDGSTIAEQRYRALQTQVVDARADLGAKEALQRQMDSVRDLNVGSDAIGEIVGSPAMQRLRDRESAILARLADERLRFGPQHPQLLSSESELSEVRSQINAEIVRVRTVTDNEVKVARSRASELESELASLERKLVVGRQADVSLKALERDVEASSSIYQNLSMAAREIAQRESLKVVDARVVSHPILPAKPSSPPAALWIALFAGLGLALAVGIALMRSMVRDTIIRPDMIQPKVGTAALISVPKLTGRQLRARNLNRANSNLYVVSRPFSPFTENFRVLSTHLWISKARERQVIAVTSAEASEGKTTISLCLGRTSAMLGRKVLVIDGDMRRPSLSRSMVGQDAAANRCLLDVLQDGADWRDAIIADTKTTMHIMPILSDRHQSEARYFKSEQFSALVEELRNHYELILIDCPPILAVAETRLFCRLADKTLLVSRWNHTRATVVKTAIREIERSQGEVLGVVLNMIHTGLVKGLSYTDVLNFGRGGKGYYESKV